MAASHTMVLKIREATTWLGGFFRCSLNRDFLCHRGFCVKGAAKGVLRKSPDRQRVNRIAGLREINNQCIRKKRNDDASELIVASAMAYSAPARVPASGDAGPGGPMPRPSLRTIFFTLWASAARYPSQSTFHSPRNRDLSHPNRSREAKVPSAMVRRRNRSRWYAAVRFRSRALE